MPVIALAYLLSFYLLALVVRDFPIGIAYAIWSGLGTSLIVLVGWLHFGDPLLPLPLVGIAIVIVGILVINISGVP